MYKEAFDLILNSNYILIITHINPDADTISSALALSNYLNKTKIKHKIINKQGLPSKRFDYLNLYNKITDIIPKYYDLVVYLDCANQKRALIDIDEKCKIINIDHHQSNSNFGAYTIVDDTKSSTAEVLYDFFVVNGIEISTNIAQCLYTGIYDDSLSLSSPRTDIDTFKAMGQLVKKGANPPDISQKLYQRDSLAKYRLLPKVYESLELYFEGKVAMVYLLPQWLDQTGATYLDCEDIVDSILNISIVDISVFLRLKDDQARVSLRGKNTDVSIIANKFGGGGHKYSAGCSIDILDINEAKDKILEGIKDEI